MGIFLQVLLEETHLSPFNAYFIYNSYVVDRVPTKMFRFFLLDSNFSFVAYEMSCGGDDREINAVQEREVRSFICLLNLFAAHLVSK